MIYEGTCRRYPGGSGKDRSVAGHGQEILSVSEERFWDTQSRVENEY